MSFWTGTHWEPDTPALPPRARPSRRRHAIEAVSEGLLVGLLIVGLAAGTTFAAKGGGGKGGGGQAPATAGCVVDGTAVSATGLPTDEVINFMLTDASGTQGWVLGFTDTGSWTEPVPARIGSTTYEFVSRTWGPNGSKYTVFSACSAG